MMRSVAEGSASVSFSEKQAGEIESGIQSKLKAHTHDIWKTICNYNFRCDDGTELMP